VSYELVERMNDRVTVSGVLQQVAQWRRDDSPRSAAARTLVSDRAVVVGLLILSGEGAPLAMTRLADLFERRIDTKALRLLELPTDQRAGGNAAHTKARWITQIS
jgi:hypothetical protein